MPAAARAYYDDSYTSAFTAEEGELSPDARRVYFSPTFFYPTSGGQPHDLGTIGSVPVIEVVDEGERIAHVLDTAAPHLFSVGPVACQIDWGRRYGHMQQHTGQHLLSAVCLDLFGFKTLSFHMGEQVSTIELGTPTLSASQIEAIEERVGEIVAEARPVLVSYEDAEAAEGLRKASARSGTLRIVEIQGIDRSACGGTHLRNTAEIGAVQVRGLDRVRGNVRIEFVCGRRARKMARQDFELLANLAREASKPAAELQDHLKILRERLEHSEKERDRMQTALAQTEGKRLYDEGERRAFLRVPEVSDAVRAMATAFASFPDTAIAILTEGLPGTGLLACSADSGLHAGSLWKTAFAAGGGRGGGSASLAQGSVSDGTVFERLARSAGCVEKNYDSHRTATDSSA